MYASPKGDLLLLAATILDRTTAFFDLLGGELFFAPYGSIACLDGPTSGFGVDVGVGATDLAYARLVIASDVASDLTGKWDQIGMRHDMVDETAFECFIGQHEIPRKTHFSGSAKANGLGEQNRESPSGHHTDARVGVAKLGMFGSDQKVAIQRQFKSASDGDTVDCSDEWFFEGWERSAYAVSIWATISSGSGAKVVAS